MLQKQNPENKDLILNMDGQLVHRDEAGVSPFDSSFQNGDTVWEGLRLYQGRIFRLQEHLDRMRKGATMLRYQGIPSDEKIIEELRRTLEANNMADNVHIRLVLSRGLKYTSGMDPRINLEGCSLFVLAEHKPPVYDRSGVRLITANQRRPFADILDQTIHSSNQLTSILAKMEAIEAGVDDALMLDPDGNMAETNATHVFVVKDGIVHTSTTRACPEGITRATVLELCEKREIPHQIRDIPVAEVHEADEVFCTGTMGEIVPVVQLDETVFNREEEGPVTGRIASLYTALTQSEGYRIIQE
ncbi:MAG: aminotransferase class IV [Planctomycetota bacterium]|nr:aminotransferase class IV [Planctomycetota bacterium]